MAMQQSGILARVLPGSDATNLAVLVHFEEMFHMAPDPIRRLALIGGEDVPRRLRLSREDQRRLQGLRDGIGGPNCSRSLGYQLKDLAPDVVVLRAAMTEMHPPEDWHRLTLDGAQAEFPIKPADLMPEFSGPALGAKLKELEERWLASGMTLTKAELLS